MKMRFRQTSLLLTLFGAWTLVGVGADALAAGKTGSTCDATVDVMPDELKAGSNSCGSACDEQNRWIRQNAEAYTTAVRNACQKNNSLLSSLGENNQKGAQGNAKTISTEASSAMGGVIQQGNRIKAETAAHAKQSLDKASRDPQSRASGAPPDAFNRSKQLFQDKDKFDHSAHVENPLESSAVRPLVKNSAEFMHKLAVDIKKREQAKTELDGMADRAGGNEENSGANKDKDGKGMDMGQLAQLAGPLAGLAGMMQQKKASDAAAESGLSDPTAAGAAGATGASTTPAEATLGNSTVPGTSTSAGKSITDGGSSKTGSNSGKTATMEGGPGTASTASSGLSATPAAYQDAFTGFGKNGTTPGNYSSTGASSSSPSGGGSAGGSGSSPEAAGRAAASASHSPAEEEALASFGGGGLAFSGGGGSSHSSSTADEPVKDFLQDAETAMGEGEFAAGPEGEVAAAETGVEGEDGTELFRRVRSALERSQRKGTVMSGLSGPKDPRFR